MRVCVVSSGSGGNCLWVEAGETRVLIDAGLSFKETARRCRDVGLDAGALTDVLLTHEHADHCAGADVLARKTSARVHATAGTLRALREPPPAERCFALAAGQPLLLGALRIEAIAVPHDAAEPVAYVFEERTACGSVRGALVTDLGSVPAAVLEALRGLDLLVLEMNHDVRMLLDGPYPYRLKQRVRSHVGHLSNAQGAQLLQRVLHPGLGHVLLAHLSEHNNTEAHALEAAEAVLVRAGRNPSLLLASQRAALEPIELCPRAATAVRARPAQLSLFAS